MNVTGSIWTLKRTKENLPLLSRNFESVERQEGFDSSRYEQACTFSFPATNECKSPLTYIYTMANLNDGKKPFELGVSRIKISDVVVITSPIFESGAFYRQNIGWKALKDLWGNE